MLKALPFWGKGFVFMCNTYLFMFFCLDAKERKNQGCIKNSSLHLQNPRKWNDFRA
jgi:hypothetical protein